MQNLSSNSENAKYSLSYISGALEDLYISSTFITNRSPSIIQLALMIGTQPDYLALGYYLFSLLLLVSCTSFISYLLYQITMKLDSNNNKSSLWLFLFSLITVF